MNWLGQVVVQSIIVGTIPRWGASRAVDLLADCLRCVSDLVRCDDRTESAAFLPEDRQAGRCRFASLLGGRHKLPRFGFCAASQSVGTCRLRDRAGKQCRFVGGGPDFPRSARGRRGDHVAAGQETG